MHNLCAAYAKAYLGDSTNELSKQISAFLNAQMMTK